MLCGVVFICDDELCRWAIHAPSGSGRMPVCTHQQVIVRFALHTLSSRRKILVAIIA